MVRLGWIGSDVRRAIVPGGGRIKHVGMSVGGDLERCCVDAYPNLGRASGAFTAPDAFFQPAPSAACASTRLATEEHN